jgi:hypothetical protein
MLSAQSGRAKVMSKNCLTPAARRAGLQARQARADQRAAKLAPILKGLQASGVTSLNGIAEALNERGALTLTGRGHWHGMQVARVLQRGRDDLQSRAMSDVSRYTFNVTQIGGRYGAWQWEICRDGQPLPARLRAVGFRAKHTATLAGKVALGDFLWALMDEQNKSD